MNKTETIHIRVAPSLKENAENVLNEMGLNISYAVSAFLSQVVLQKKIPFEISLNSKESEIEEEIAAALNLTGGKEIDQEGKQIIHLFATNQIDYETAVFALKRRFSHE